MRRLRSRLLLSSLLAGFSGSIGLTVGCFPQATNRAQVAEDPEKDQFATVGSKTEIGNADPIPVSGVGLVYSLRGTGSSPPADGWRQMLETALKKRDLDTKLLLDDPERRTSLVLVSAAIPPGCRRGDKVDAVITLPQGSKTSSLQYGILDVCTLSNFEMAGSVRQQLLDNGIKPGQVPLAQSNSVLMGSKLAAAEGPLVTGALVVAKPAGNDSSAEADAVESNVAKIAKIWGGTTCQVDRPYYFLINRTTPQPRLAMIIAARLNAVFHGGDATNKIADAKVVEGGPPYVAVFVPTAYRNNHERFLLVARNVPIQAGSPQDAYRKKLAQDLLQPSSAIEAAIKLEALGVEGEEYLKVGLESDSTWVKFAAATSLAYLGKADSRVAALLGQLADKHPALRTHCLLALAAQDDAPCVDQLVDLMRKSDHRLRYGAFTALRTANERHDAIRGRRMGNSYTLHAVAGDSESLVHLTTDRRNEVVLFGHAWPLRGPFSLPLGSEFTVTQKEPNGEVVITRVQTGKRDADDNLATITGTYKPDLDDVLKGLASLGGSYTEAIEFIRRAASADVLMVPIAVDCMPRSFSIPDLARISRVDPDVAKANETAEKHQYADPSTEPSNSEVPSEGDAVRAQPRSEPALNRTQGSVLRAFESEKTGPPLNRQPGSLFGK